MKRYVYYGNIVDFVGNMVSFYEKYTNVDMDENTVSNEWMLKRIEKEKQLALHLCGKLEMGNLREGFQYITVLPAELECFTPIICCIKEDNNGNTFIVTNFEMPLYKKTFDNFAMFEIEQEKSIDGQTFEVARRVE